MAKKIIDFGMDELLSSQTSSIDEEEMTRMENSAVPETTSRATKSGVKKFTEWLKKRQIDEINITTITPTELSPILRKFYAEVRKENGKALTPSSLVGIRAALHRYFVSAPYYRQMNIVSGADFMTANKMFDAKCKLFYKAGNEKPKHKAVIEKDDMKKVGEYFKNWHQNPVILTEAVWFMLCYHFGRRGREGWAEMYKNTFSIVKSPEGDYVECRKSERSKNLQGGTDK